MTGLVLNESIDGYFARPSIPNTFQFDDRAVQLTTIDRRIVPKIACCFPYQRDSVMGEDNARYLFRTYRSVSRPREREFK